MMLHCRFGFFAIDQMMPPKATTTTTVASQRPGRRGLVSCVIGTRVLSCAIGGGAPITPVGLRREKIDTSWLLIDREHAAERRVLPRCLEETHRHGAT